MPLPSSIKSLELARCLGRPLNLVHLTGVPRESRELSKRRSKWGRCLPVRGGCGGLLKSLGIPYAIENLNSPLVTCSAGRWIGSSRICVCRIPVGRRPSSSRLQHSSSARWAALLSFQPRTQAVEMENMTARKLLWCCVWPSCNGSYASSTPRNHLLAANNASTVP